MMRTLRRTLAMLSLLLLLSPVAAPQGKIKSWLRGNWEGTGYQTDDNSTWPMRLTITKSPRRTFLIEYPSLNCGGRWKLLSASRSSARFRELLDHGQDKCTDKGLVMIERRRGQLVYLYSLQGSRELTATAILNRKRTPVSQ